MKLLAILLQSPPLAGDTAAAAKLKAATDSVRAGVDSLAQNLTNPDSLLALSPAKVASGLKQFDWTGVMATLSTQAVSFCLRLLAAIAIFYIGKFIIGKIHAVARTVMIKRDFDRSLASFLLSLIRISLLFVLIVTVIGVLGIETSSFIAIFASAGVAIGMALSGTLQNFAGGVLLLLLKPYKVGDYIEFGELKGFVREIQIFHTILTTYNNERIIVPNGSLSTGSINNISSEPYRRLEWRVSINYGDDVAVARQAILALLDAEPRIVAQDADEQSQQPSALSPQTGAQAPPPETQSPEQQPWWKRIFHQHKQKAAQWKAQQVAEIQSKLPRQDFTPTVALEQLGDNAVVLVVRAWCANADYWSVLYAINEQLYTTLPKHGIHFPFPQLDVHVKNYENINQANS